MPSESQVECHDVSSDEGEWRVKQLKMSQPSPGLWGFGFHLIYKQLLQLLFAPFWCVPYSDLKSFCLHRLWICEFSFSGCHIPRMKEILIDWRD